MTILAMEAVNHHIIRGYAEHVSSQEGRKLSCDVDKSTGRKHILSASAVDAKQVVDISWLPAAAEEFHISPDIKDYVIAEVPIVEGNVPNRNMHCFLTSRLAQFLPQYGMPAYRTFVGKPTFLEHDHDDITAAKGVIFDASLKCVNGRWHVYIIKGFCRQKDPQLAEAVFSGKRKGHSMSSWASHFGCSICGHVWDTSYANACDCAKGPIKQRQPDQYRGFGQVYDGNKLCYAVVDGMYFIESSSVGDAANYAAQQVFVK
jgi:hypothetical protein